ncbi:MAG: S9 family peptidase [Acidobacteriota bacterium]
MPASLPALIPRRVLFGNPSRGAPRISPDGTRLAFRAPYEGVMNLWVSGIGDPDPRPITTDGVGGIRRHVWARGGRRVLYLQDVGGDENTHVKCVDVATGVTRDLTPHDGVQAGIVATSPRHPERVLVAMNLDDPHSHDVYRIDLATGDRELVAKNPGNVIGYLGDLDLEPRAAGRMREDGGMDLVVRDGSTGEWRDVLTWDHEDTFYSHPVACTADGRGIFLYDARGADTTRLVLHDVPTGRDTVLAQDPEGDVAELLLHPVTQQPQMVAFERDRIRWRALHPEHAADIDLLARAHRGDFQVIDQSDDARIWVVAFAPDDGPVAFHAFDRIERRITHLFDHAPDLLDHTLAAMTPVAFAARDGLEIHGYLTLPPGRGRDRVPMVLLVHGGPGARDSWGFDPEAQLFANRGYAVLQVNYRGSTGYGKAFRNAGDREWGGKMHDDLVDAVGWAVAQGYADPARVAIYGGSYGGYAALVGATFTPDLFRCAVDIVGPSNLITFVQTLPPYWHMALADFHRRVGHPEKDAEFMRSRSPLFRAHQIKVPLLIAQGANDPRVKASESEQIVAALRSRGIEHEYMLFPDEGHGFEKASNRLRFYEAAEKFLARHLGGRCEE